MRAVVCNDYGSPDVLQLEERPKPTPGTKDVLVRVHASTVTAGDCEVRRFDIPPLFWLPVRLFVGVKRPRNGILGQELSGTIEAVGSAVENFHVGDEIFAATGPSTGAYADYICLPASGAIALKPANMTHEEAAAVPTGGLNALHFLMKADLQIGQHILIHGAGGSIGTAAVQIAKALGAEVTAVDTGSKLNMLRSIGADHLINYARDDFSERGENWDVIFDAAGKCSFAKAIKSLTQTGVYVSANPSLLLMIRGLWTSKTTEKKVMTGFARDSSDDLNHLKGLIEAGRLRTVIDRRYPLEEMADAHRYVETGEKAGNVVILIH